MLPITFHSLAAIALLIVLSAAVEAFVFVPGRLDRLGSSCSRLTDLRVPLGLTARDGKTFLFNKISKDERVQRVWFELLNTEGKPFTEATDVTAVYVSSVALVDDLKDAVKMKFDTPGFLKDIPAATLKVFKNQAAKKAQKPLQAIDPVDGMGTTKDPMVVLVPEFAIPGLMPIKQPKFGWNSTRKVKSLKYDRDQALFTLDASYLRDSGLDPTVTRKLMLYCRPAFHEQFEFLRERVINNGYIGWIVGPPGTGKSATALAFAATLDHNEWGVTWIHLDRSELPICVRYDGKTKRICEIRDTISFDDLYYVLDEIKEEQKHIIFLDGYVLDVEKHVDIYMTCSSWSKKGPGNRRLVVVCSMSTRGRAKWHDDIRKNMKEFFVYSWTVEEYLAASRYSDFFNNIKHNLDSCNDEQVSATDEVMPATSEDLILSKFHFAGGCSRYMFNYNTDVVIASIAKSVLAVPNFLTYSQGVVGDGSESVINSLFSSYRNPNGGGDSSARITRIVSAWAASELATKCGPELVKNLAEVIEEQSNPAMDGWLFEMWFFALLKKSGVQFCDELGNSMKEVWSPCKDVRVYSKVPALPDDSGVWLKPRKHNQAGFDAIFVDKREGLVRFVQVTRGDTHSFNIKPFADFLKELEDSVSKFAIKKVDIVYLVPPKNIQRLKITSKSDQLGLLSKYDETWTEGNDEDRVRILGIRGWGAELGQA